MQYQRQTGRAAGKFHLWPRPLSSGALRIAKALLGGALVLILLVQLLGTAGVGTLINNLFTVLFLLSLSGPARKLLRRRAGPRDSSQRETE